LRFSVKKGRHARRARLRSRRLAVYTSLVRCGPSRVPLSLPSGRDPTCALPCTCSIERRWSSRRFPYGYLVTTSSQLPVSP